MKIRPITAARWSSSRCVPGSRSMRAEISDCSVSGIRSTPPRVRSASMRTVSSTYSGLPSVFASTVAVSMPSSSSSSDVSAATSSALSSGGSGSSSIAVDADAASAPGRAHVQQLGARDAEQEQRHLAHPGGEMLDQLEQRLLAPVDVLEQEHERLRLGELLRPRARRPGDLLLRPLALDRLEHADREAEQVGDRLVLAVRAQLRPRLVERVVVGDPRGRLDHLGERPVRDALAVREAAAGEDGRAFEPGDELAREPALPHVPDRRRS